jgi:hypothetical protein
VSVPRLVLALLIELGPIVELRAFPKVVVFE